MARDRYDDEHDDDDRPSRRGPRRRDDDDDNDDYDDRPRRRRRRGSSGGGPLDSTFGDTSTLVLVLFAICCGGIAFILSLIGYTTSRDDKAKSNALMVLIISGIITAVNIVVWATGNLPMRR